MMMIITNIINLMIMVHTVEGWYGGENIERKSDHTPLPPPAIRSSGYLLVQKR